MDPLSLAPRTSRNSTVLSGHVPVSTNALYAAGFKDVVEHVVPHLHRRVVTHVEPRGQINPFPVVLGKLKLSVAGKFRPITRGSRILTERGQQNEGGQD